MAVSEVGQSRDSLIAPARGSRRSLILACIGYERLLFFDGIHLLSLLRGKKGIHHSGEATLKKNTWHLALAPSNLCIDAVFGSCWIPMSDPSSLFPPRSEGAGGCARHRPGLFLRVSGCARRDASPGESKRMEVPCSSEEPKTGGGGPKKEIPPSMVLLWVQNHLQGE